MNFHEGPIPTFLFFNKVYGVPVFVFHEVNPDLLEEYFTYLSKNNYQTLNSNELYDLFKKNHPGYNLTSPKKIVITFDDGRLTNWTVVYPLAQKYKIKIVLFVIPELINKEAGRRPNLSDDILSQDYFISWDEARKMHQSGLIDIQSHGLRHDLVFTDDKIIDFHNPNNRYLSLFLNREAESGEPNFGAPIYSYTWRPLTDRVYIEDEGLKNACMDYVNTHGGEDFFKKSHWKKELFAKARGYKKKNKLKDGFEVIAKSEDRLVKDLKLSRTLIENSLNKTCHHIALPLHRGNSVIYNAIKQAGFLSIYNGSDINYNRNFKLDDSGLCHIRRFQGYWIKSLPGEGRLSFAKRVFGRLNKFID